MRFQFGLPQNSPDPLAGFKGPISKGRGQEGKEGSQEGEGKGRYCAFLTIP